MERRRSRLERKNRGAVSNHSGRFEAFEQTELDDGWGNLDQELVPLRTTVTAEKTRSLISRNQSPDVPFDRSINPYKGCEHGCIYCFARPTHAYLGLSCGQDFESRLFCKPDGPEVLRRELARPGYRCRPIAIGANTDPYQPIEREQKLTRAIIEVLAAHRHPISIITKSNLILRDLDLLAEMAEAQLCQVMVSITTLRRSLARRMEPRAPTPRRRIEAVRELAGAKIPVGVLVAPLIPGLNDHELEAILDAVAEAGAKTARYLMVRLPLEIKELFEEWLATHYPDRADRVLSLIRDIRGGQLYDSRFGHRMRGTGPYAGVIEQRFRVAATRTGLLGQLPELDTAQFCVPPEYSPQLDLFSMAAKAPIAE